MPKTISAETITLYDLEQRFGLQPLEDAQFSRVAREPTRVGRGATAERVLTIYANLRRSVLENTVKMAIVSPLDLAGFHRST